MLTAGQIDNFALQQVNGQAWELKRDRKGRLILLDFWHTRCPPCLAAIGHLNELEQAYRARGLEVIGVACETGPFDQRVQRITSIRSRYDIRYRLLLAGDQGIKPCPLCTQMGVAAYPTLKLINERGEVLWESQGLAERNLYDLKREIERRLPLTR
jgi:thiol-disulfide isomerase/thioredoxin